MYFSSFRLQLPNHALIIPQLRCDCMSCGRWRDACVCPLSPRIWVYSFHALDASLPPRTPPPRFPISLALPSYYTLSARSEALWDGVREREGGKERTRERGNRCSESLSASFPIPEQRTCTRFLEAYHTIFHLQICFFWEGRLIKSVVALYVCRIADVFRWNCFYANEIHL